MAAICDQNALLIERGLSKSDILLLMKLANRANYRTGRCDPGYGRLVKDTGLSKNQIPISLQALWRAGILDWTERWKSDSKGRRPNLYDIFHRVDPLKPKKVILQPKPPKPKGEKRVMAKCPFPGAMVQGLPVTGIPGALPQLPVEGVPATGIGCTSQSDTLYQPLVEGVPVTGTEPVLISQEDQSGIQPGTVPGEGGGQVLLPVSIRAVRENRDLFNPVEKDYKPREKETNIIPVDRIKPEHKDSPTTRTSSLPETIPDREPDGNPVQFPLVQSKSTTTTTAAPGKPDSQSPVGETKMAETKITSDYGNLSPAEKLARDYFLYMKEPAPYNNPATRQRWAAAFQDLLARHSFVKLKDAIRFAWTETNFWQDKLHRRSGDPVAYFVEKFEQPGTGIEAAFLSWQHAQSLVVRSPSQTEADPLAGTGLQSTPMSVIQQQMDAAQPQKDREKEERRIATAARRAREAEATEKVAIYLAKLAVVQPGEQA